MDHLPHPGRDISPIRVPLLPLHPVYDTLTASGGFTNLPEPHDYAPGVKYPDRTAAEVASFAQSFLYFGLLSDFLQRRVEPCTLAERTSLEDGAIQEILSAQKLKAMLVAHLMEVEGSLLEVQREDDRRSGLLKSTQWQLSRLERICQPVEEPLPTILLSIEILIETLGTTFLRPPDRHRKVTIRTTRQQYSEADFKPSRPLAREDLYISMSSRLLTSMMLKNGWCPAQIFHALCSFPFSLCYYLAHVQRFPREDTDHNACTERQCVAYNIVQGAYRTAHRNTCTGCKSIEAPLGEVERLVREGKIPLLRVKWSKHRELSLDVKESRYDDKYVAISHVWSDGLGNEIANSLPQCQLERISKIIEEFPRLSNNLNAPGLVTSTRLGTKIILKSRFFWIDTLCVPIDSHLKKLAINAIPAVYAGATQVLALDAEMEHVSLRGSQWPEVAGRLIFSAWAGRAWTLEEAGFSTACGVRVADGCFDPQKPAEHHGFVYRLTASPIPSKEYLRVVKQAWHAFRDRRRSSVQDRLSRKFDKGVAKLICAPLDDFFLQSSRVDGQKSSIPREISLRPYSYSLGIHFLNGKHQLKTTSLQYSYIC